MLGMGIKLILIFNNEYLLLSINAPVPVIGVAKARQEKF